MKFLLDEHVEGFDKKLLEKGHQVEYAKRLRNQDQKFRNDFNLIMYSKENDMVFVTKNNEPGQACEDNNIPCIWISDDRIFDEMILPRLEKLSTSL